MPQTPSTRWCPTPEQLMILEDRYGSGVRNPSAAQIQQITAHLSLYGKIECKNVFYWFQNHKARDRQKQLRLISSSLHHLPHQEMNLVGKLEGGDQSQLDAGAAAAAARGTASSLEGGCKTPKTLDLFPVTKTSAGVKDDDGDECSCSKSTQQ